MVVDGDCNDKTNNQRYDDQNDDHVFLYETIAGYKSLMSKVYSLKNTHHLGSDGVGLSVANNREDKEERDTDH